MRPRADAAPSFVFADHLPAKGSTVAFDEDESHYLGRVVRARVGESVTATDGRGVRAEVELIAIGREAQGRIVQREELPRARTLVLACGAPEGDRGDWLVEKLAELGASAFQPLDADRGGWDHIAARAQRWQRLARAALRQSRACWSLELQPVLPLRDWLAGLVAAERFLADPAGTSAARRPAPASGSAVVAVGPSSGFSEHERKALVENEFQLVALAGARLRTETAALAAAAWWSAADES